MQPGSVATWASFGLYGAESKRGIIPPLAPAPITGSVHGFTFKRTIGQRVTAAARASGKPAIQPIQAAPNIPKIITP